MHFIHTPVELTELQTQEVKGHRWYIIPNGDLYPSITTLLGSKPKPHLDNWRKMLGEDKADKETKRCADRGTAVHLMVERFINNEDPFVDQTRENIKLFNQIRLIIKNKINNIQAQEVPLYSEVLKVAGRVDCIAEYDGVLSIIDFKTSNNNKTESMIEDYLLQETFYALAFYELTGKQVKQIVTIMTVERGIMPLVWIKPINPYIIPLQKRIDEFYNSL
jgi:genome maintenance exonuclease 1